MASGKTGKLVVHELLQFAALTAVPIFAVLARLGRLIREERGGDHTADWLVVVAVSIACVAAGVGSCQIPHPADQEVHLRDHTVGRSTSGRDGEGSHEKQNKFEKKGYQIYID